MILNERLVSITNQIMHNYCLFCFCYHDKNYIIFIEEIIEGRISSKNVLAISAFISTYKL